MENLKTVIKNVYMTKCYEMACSSCNVLQVKISVFNFHFLSDDINVIGVKIIYMINLYLMTRLSLNKTCHCTPIKSKNALENNTFAYFQNVKIQKR